MEMQKYAYKLKYCSNGKIEEEETKNYRKIARKKKDKDKLALFSGCAYSERYIDDRNYNKTRHIYRL